MRASAPVVVTDGFWPKTLVAVRALHAAGETVYCGEQTRWAGALWSRDCRRAFRYPDPVTRNPQFVARLRDLVASQADAVLLPMEEETLLAVARSRHDLEDCFALPVADLELLQKLRDKGWLAAAAARHGLAIPDTLVPVPGRPLWEQVRPLGLPLVVKLRISSGARGVWYAETLEQLQQLYDRASQLQDRPVVQRRLPATGEAIGVALLMDGRSTPSGLIAACVHRRLRQFPAGGGSSTFREALVDEELVERSAGFLARLGFHGVAMLEYKRDLTTGELLLLEVNPRFWGSLHQAILAGVNFPQLLVRLARGESPDPVLRYRTDLRSRAFFPGDLLHFLTTRPSPPWRSFFRLRDPMVRDEALSWRDPLPVLGRAAGFLSLAWKPGLRRLLKPNASGTPSCTTP
jgi:predicted ATP-grasp superfamily ATP-dependent carboligase